MTVPSLKLWNTTWCKS